MTPLGATRAHRLLDLARQRRDRAAELILLGQLEAAGGRRPEDRRVCPMSERDQFLWMRSVQISAFEAQTEEEDAALWADAQKAADIFWPPPGAVA